MAAAVRAAGRLAVKKIWNRTCLGRGLGKRPTGRWSGPRGNQGKHRPVKCFTAIFGCGTALAYILTLGRQGILRPLRTRF